MDMISPLTYNDDLCATDLQMSRPAKKDKKKTVVINRKEEKKPRLESGGRERVPFGTPDVFHTLRAPSLSVSAMLEETAVLSDAVGISQCSPLLM
jgi:hypothetical protein